MRLQYRAYAGIGLALWLCSYAIWTLQRFASAPPPGMGDYYGAGAAVERFRSVRAAVPPGSEIGYITDLPADNPELLTLWLTARYAMAPAVLKRDPTASSLVLGDLRRPEARAQFLAQSGFRIERDFGNGVLLLRRGR